MPNTDGVTTRRTALVAAVVALLVTAAVLWIGRADSARLVTDSSGSSDGPFSTEGPRLAGPDRFHVVYGGGVCVEDGDLATITSIEPRDAHGGLEVSGFSVFQRPASHGIEMRTGARLGEMPDFHGGESIGSECGKGALEEIVIEVYKPEKRDAWASDFTVHYVADGRRATTNIQVGVALCETKGCNPFDV